MRPVYAARVGSPGLRTGGASSKRERERATDRKAASSTRLAVRVVVRVASVLA